MRPDTEDDPFHCQLCWWRFQKAWQDIVEGPVSPYPTPTLPIKPLCYQYSQEDLEHFAGQYGIDLNDPIEPSTSE